MKDKEIPVIAFNPDSSVWEPMEKGSELSKAAAIYKNQLVETERESFLGDGDSGELHAFRSERRLAAMAERNKANTKKKRFPKGFGFFVVIAMIFYILWWVLQSQV